MAFISQPEPKAKLKGMHIDTSPTFIIGIVGCLKIVWFEFAKIKGGKIILLLHVKSLSFGGADIKGFTVVGPNGCNTNDRSTDMGQVQDHNGLTNLADKTQRSCKWSCTCTADVTKSHCSEWYNQ